jgi:hypothetical protein
MENIKNETVSNISIDVEDILQQIQNIIDMFESNNKVVGEPENTIFIITYLLLAILAGKTYPTRSIP